MTQSSVDRLTVVCSSISQCEADFGRQPGSVTLIAVSKMFSDNAIMPVLAAGQRIFGENYVQETKAKWPSLREKYPDAHVHMIGPLQSNKAAEAIRLFDAIHTVDRESLAAALGKELKKTDRRPSFFVQVNTGLEPQKGGVAPRDTEAFVARCREVHGLAVSGLMCIPPFDQTPSPHFGLLAKLAKSLGLADLSMGMSSDFDAAIQLGATHVRVGSAIFGSR